MFIMVGAFTLTIDAKKTNPTHTKINMNMKKHTQGGPSLGEVYPKEFVPLINLGPRKAHRSSGPRQKWETPPVR